MDEEMVSFSEVLRDYYLDRAGRVCSGVTVEHYERWRKLRKLPLFQDLYMESQKCLTLKRSQKNDIIQTNTTDEALQYGQES